MEYLPLALFLVLATGTFLAVSRLGKLNPEEAKTLLANGAHLVDVRTTDEFASGHLDGAVNIPLHEIAKRHGEIGRKSEPVIVYCASGMRSRLAKNQLSKRGYSKVYDLGSMSRWRA